MRRCRSASRSLPDAASAERAVLEALAARGYQEAITYAFVDPAAAGAAVPRASRRSRSPTRSRVICRSCGCRCGRGCCARRSRISAASRIASGCSSTARAFATGARPGATQEIDTLAGIACGHRLPEQWGVPQRMREPADFYDVKADLEALLAATGARARPSASSPACARLLCTPAARRACCARRSVGWLGELHPALVKALDFTYAPVLFELDVAAALRCRAAQLTARSRASRRCGATSPWCWMSR